MKFEIVRLWNWITGYGPKSKGYGQYGYRDMVDMIVQNQKYVKECGVKHAKKVYKIKID
jgi:hypothetical protein